jgi:hypothetical protein
MEQAETQAENNQNEQKETIQKEITANNKAIFNLEIERNSSLKIKIKVSQDIENWFKENGTESTTHSAFNTNKTIKYYKLAENRELTNCFQLNDINERVFYNNTINSAILRIVGISSGIEISVKQLISKEQLIESAKNLKESVINFYKRYINAVHITTTLTINEL